MRLLVTRPAPDGERTAAILRARGHDTMVAALVRVDVLPDADLGMGPWSGILLTSANAARALAQNARRPELLRLPAFVVGEHTAQAARAAGFGEVVSADGNAVDLALLIAANAREGSQPPLLYLAGEDRAADIAAALAAQGVRIQTVVVYRAIAATHFPPLAWAAISLGRLDGVLHYSRRSAQIYVNCARGARMLDKTKALFHYCLSAQVAGPLVEQGVTNIRVAPRPNEEALLDLVEAR
jgi:uroporphyrinogen-III synthase